MKKLLSAICISLCVIACHSKSEPNWRSLIIKPAKDSSWKVDANGKAKKVSDRLVHRILVKELIFNRYGVPIGLDKDTLRKVVDTPYRKGDTFYVAYLKRWYVVQ